jgi:dihydroorotase-like cyclic amidohydrolase
MDLVIRGNCVVTPYAIGPAEIGIAGEKIVAIAAPVVRARRQQPQALHDGG